MVGVGGDQDRAGHCTDPRYGLQTRRQRFRELRELAVVLSQPLRLLEDGSGESSCLFAEHTCGGVVSIGSPGRDRRDLGVGERFTGVDREVDATDKCGEGVAVRGALLIDESAGSCGSRSSPGSSGPTTADADRPASAV